jgi:hypothetical protein
VLARGRHTPCPLGTSTSAAAAPSGSRRAGSVDPGKNTLSVVTLMGWLATVAPALAAAWNCVHCAAHLLLMHIDVPAHRWK